MIIFGESFLKLKSSKYLFNKTKKLIKDLNKNENWDVMNLISRNASSVGCYDLNIISEDHEKKNIFERLNDKTFSIVFLFGQDNLKFIKNNEFVIYVGTHGDKGAEIADVILPSASYTEQDGYYTNIEGKIQKAYKANYPPGDAKEDWVIINELSFALKDKVLFQNRDDLSNNLMNFLKLNKNKIEDEFIEEKIFEENIFVDEIDYYFSNVIARASKTMSECKNARLNLKKTGTEG